MPAARSPRGSGAGRRTAAPAHPRARQRGVAPTLARTASFPFAHASPGAVTNKVAAESPALYFLQCMQATEWIWLNGRLVQWADATVHVASHGLHYGSGVFEGIRAYETAGGSAIFRLTDHLRRLHDSARLLGLRLRTRSRSCDSRRSSSLPRTG